VLHYYIKCHNLTLKECEDEIHIPEMRTWESSGTPEIPKFDYKGQNTSHWGVFISLKSYQSLDVKNGFAWAIWTFVAQVMAKRKPGSQTGSLSPDH